MRNVKRRLSILLILAILVQNLVITSNANTLVIDPTCTEPGRDENGNIIEAPGHCFVGGRCIVCNDIDPDYVYPTESEPTESEATEPEETPNNKNSISVEILEKDILNYNVLAGTVVEDDGNEIRPVESMPIELYIKRSEGITYTNIELNVELPEGFSFKENTLETEKKIVIGELKEDTSRNLTIYPIYLEKEVASEPCKMIVKISAIDSDREAVQKTEKEVFFEPLSVNYTAYVDRNDWNSTVYEFSLDTAFGNGVMYNTESARLSAILSKLAYDKAKIEDFLVLQLGFENFEAHDISKADGTTNTCGRYLASKKIIQDGEIKNIVYVVCRGTPLDAEEWAGNFTVGLGNKHINFYNIASNIKNNISKFYELHQLSKENTVFLVTGHSRGAAAANLVGNWLNTTANVAQKENVSVYTFATPTVDRSIVNESVGVKGNENIFNFVNYQDIIRNAAPMQYYGRYGITTYFAFDIAPTGATEHTDGYGVYALPIDGSGYTMSEIMNAIVYDADTNSTASVDQALTRMSRFITSLRSLYNRNLVGLGTELLAAHDMPVYYSAVVNNAAGAPVNEINARTEDALNYFLTSPTVQKAYEIETAKWDAIKLIVHICKCPVNLYVLDAAGNVVASIVDKQVSCADADLQITMCGDALMVCYLDTGDGRYSFQLEGYDDGAVTHCMHVIEQDGTEKLYKRKAIPVSDGQILNVNEMGFIPVGNEAAEDAEAAYQTYDNAEEIDQILDGLDSTEPQEPSEPSEPSHDHSWVAATCTTPRTCTSCGITEGEALGHKAIVVSGKEATCTATGLTDGKKCSVCDTIIVAQEEIAAKGHSEQTIIGKEATCTNSGLTDGKKCTICGTVTVAQLEIATKGHNFQDGKCSCGAEDPNYIKPVEGVTRLAGSSRYETSFAIGNEMKDVLGVDKFESIILASSEGFADALAGSYLAAVKQAPIIIGKLKYAGIVCDYVNANLASGGTVYVLGGEGAVPEAMLSGITVTTNFERLAGDDRYTTNLAILGEAGVVGKDILVATGQDFADSLSASATGLPILLVNGKPGKTLSDVQKQFMANVEGNIYIIGGTSAVPDSMVAQIEAASGKATTRIAGGSRYETSVKITEKFFTSTDSAVVAFAGDYPDGLCGGPLAYAVKAPLILTKDGKAEAPAYTESKGITSGYVLGGDGLISDNFAKTIFSAKQILK